MNFSDLNLNDLINKAIAACGYDKPTPVQAKSIPVILDGKDVIVSAQTGTGKTAAFVLPALHHLSNHKQTQKGKKARILILTPTRELATQITKAAMLYGKFCRFNIVSLVGGMSYHSQIKDLSRGADIIVATPGRLLDHINQKRVDLSGIDMLVLDEADRMCDMGFIDDVQYISKLTPSKRQTLLFSATVDKRLTEVVRHLLNEPVRIDLSNKKVTATNVEQIFYKVNSPHHKQRLLQTVLTDTNIFKAIIFSATKINADRLSDMLEADGFSVAALHGDLRQNVRNRTLDALRRGKIQFLVATDVAARGIDIGDITHVINYDLPKFNEDYVHRIGRTARAGKAGKAISFVLPNDLRHVKNIEKFIGQRLTLQASPAIISPETGAEVEFNASHWSENSRKQSSEEGFAKRIKRKIFSSKKDDSSNDSRRGRFSDKSDSRRNRSNDNSDDRRSRFGDSSEKRRSRPGDNSDDRRSRFGDSNENRRSRSIESSDDRRSRFSDSNDNRRSKFGDRSDSRRGKSNDSSDDRRSRFSDKSDNRRSKPASGDRSSKKTESYTDTSLTAPVTYRSRRSAPSNSSTAPAKGKPRRSSFGANDERSSGTAPARGNYGRSNPKSKSGSSNKPFAKRGSGSRNNSRARAS